jgi:GT2 family glycosyltransferase/glycosyltransferase involved in cell wall biosynthesis
VVTLPSGNAGAYVEAIRDLSTGVYVFHYPQWYAQRDADEYFTTCFCDIIVKHDIDLVYANTCVLLEPLIAAKRMGRRRLVHTREIITLDAPLQKRIGLSGEEIIQEVFGRTDYIIANSKATYDIFSRRDRTFYVPNAVNVDDFNMTNEVGDKIVFGIVSSNIPKKGIEDFVAVANECQRLTNKAEFAIIGPDNDYVRSLLNDGAAANIRFLGYYDSPVTAISKVNVLMNLSHFAESFGRTVAEAMAARRPVIAYEWGAVPELVDHEVTGLLAPYRDIAEVAQHVVRLCENKSLITSYGEKGRQRVIEKFSTECLARAVDQAMGSIFGAPTGRMSELLQWEKVENKPERVSVVIPVYNAFEEVSECLQQIERYTDLSSTRIFVINDASPDERISEVLNSYRGKAGFEIVENEKNLGYTRTINKGIELAGRDDVILLNSDAFVTPNWISGLRIAAYRGSDIGTVTAMSDNAGAFSFPVMGERNLRPEHFTAEEFSLRMVRATGQCDPIEVPTGSGFCMYIRRALIDAIGLFDAETFAKGYGEENDYCMRALSAGWRNVITPWAYVYHERNASFKGQKILLLEQGLASVEARYPKYTALTKESFASKAMRKLREAAQSAYNGDST